MSLFRGENPTLGTSAAVVSPVSGNANLVPVTYTVDIAGLGASSTSQTVFIADASYIVDSVSVSYGTASTSGTMQVEKATGTQAVGSGTNVLQGTFNLATTANTTYSTLGSSPAAALVTNPNTLTMAAGNRLNLIFAGTMTSLANCCVVIQLRRAA